MKQLTDQEIRFIKETGWTPNFEQMDYADFELKGTPYESLTVEEARAKFQKLAKDYGINLDKLYLKACDPDNSDEISLEFDATYLIYTFLNTKQLIDMDASKVLYWLQGFKYYYGFRKWTTYLAQVAIQEALEVHAGTREFYITDEGEVWNREKED